MKQKIQILHEDDALIIVNKVAGMLTIPDRYDHDQVNLLSLLKKKREEVFVVHRLDKGTSGVLCFAKTAEAHRLLSGQFAGRETEKIYWCIVEGRVTPAAGRIEQPIGRTSGSTAKMVVTPKGKPSMTTYRVMDQYSALALVEANILTGRTHQVRVHLASIGNPLTGDPLYGGRPAFFLSEIKGKRYRTGKDREERPLLARPALHARSLTLTHPLDGKRRTFEADLPKDMKAVLFQLAKHHAKN